MPAFLAGAVLALAGVALPGHPEAGAWTQPEGKGLVIFSTVRRATPVSSLFSGQARDDQNASQAFVEYGLLDGLTIGGSLFAETSTVNPGEGAVLAGVFARKRLWQGERGVFSVQAGYKHSLDSILPQRFAGVDGEAASEADFRLLYGHSFWGDWGSAFVSTEAGYTYFNEGEADEVRLDVTAGYQYWRCCQAVLSLFSQFPVQDGGDTGLDIAPSITYTFFPDTARNQKKPLSFLPDTIQLGLVYDVLDRDQGLGIQISIWRRF